MLAFAPVFFYGSAFRVVALIGNLLLKQTPVTSTPFLLRRLPILLQRLS
jgi:hypothetical protein